MESRIEYLPGLFSTCCWPSKIGVATQLKSNVNMIIIIEPSRKHGTKYNIVFPRADAKKQRKRKERQGWLQGARENMVREHLVPGRCQLKKFLTIFDPWGFNPPRTCGLVCG
jgi:hypothetical protein